MWQIGDALVSDTSQKGSTPFIPAMSLLSRLASTQVVWDLAVNQEVARSIRASPAKTEHWCNE